MVVRAIAGFLGLFLLYACSRADIGAIREQSAHPVSLDPAQEPVDLVYPQLDSANSRWFYFDSASLPFGMVNLSPDTQVDGAWGSGYRYEVEEVKGLSHVHAWQMSGVSVLPVSSDATAEAIRVNSN